MGSDAAPTVPSASHDPMQANVAQSHPLPPSSLDADPHSADGTREVGGGGTREEGSKGDARAPQRESSIWHNDLPPSPPLTRPNTSHSARHEVLEQDITEETIGKGYSEDANHDLSKTVVEHGADVEYEEVKPRVTVVRQASRIQVDTKLEPQPWDLVDPPETNGQTNAEYYASQKYNNLGSVRARALIPKSSYYFGPPPSDSAYGTQPMGQIGVHHPREILRVERDYTGGELIQFAPIYPLELEGRITPTQFLESINAVNELLIAAHSLRHSFLDNFLSVFTLQLSRLLMTTHFEKKMRQLQQLIDELNAQVYNPVGLNILWPKKVAFLFMEIEYY
ncbi:Golgin subfamily A member 7/ERF4 family-domain-containing protein [Mycena belliarum]|uniref:Ras modification protein ERF4 n=1 Tax=Mycena belliarum TaxID=1033014 RepID=A0AAD6UJL6_9AGAR|nr:Golgin subfamily A member 7/ERF4 family-domain-containing protein [Mycena belliae]